jgi:hypothetical protein
MYIINGYWYFREKLDFLIEYIEENLFFVAVALFAFLTCGCVFGALFMHFFMGFNIPNLAVVNEGTASYWGQLGDFAGGFLNPLLSFLALMAVLRTMALQRAEMMAAQRETKIATQEQRQQTAVYSKQMFESTLFGMLDAQAKILRDVSCSGPENEIYEGRRAIEMIVEKFKSTDSYTGSALYPELVSAEVVQGQIDLFCVNWKSAVGHYFRNLYSILKMIDSSQELMPESKRHRFATSRRVYTDYVRKRSYTNIVRAQLSEAEMALLQINCLGSYGEDLKFYVELYSMLKPLEHNYFESWSRYMNDEFDDLAFFGLEQIKDTTIAKIRADRARRNTSKIRMNSGG